MDNDPLDVGYIAATVVEIMATGKDKPLLDVEHTRVSSRVAEILLRGTAVKVQLIIPRGKSTLTVRCVNGEIHETNFRKNKNGVYDVLKISREVRTILEDESMAARDRAEWTATFLDTLKTLGVDVAPYDHIVAHGWGTQHKSFPLDSLKDATDPEWDPSSRAKRRKLIYLAGRWDEDIPTQDGKWFDPERDFLCLVAVEYPYSAVTPNVRLVARTAIRQWLRGAASTLTGSPTWTGLLYRSHVVPNFLDFIKIDGADPVAAANQIYTYHSTLISLLEDLFSRVEAVNRAQKAGEAMAQNIEATVELPPGFALALVPENEVVENPGKVDLRVALRIRAEPEKIRALITGINTMARNLGISDLRNLLGQGPPSEWSTPRRPMIVED